MQRRTVLRSAVKLAYATPLVIASMQVPTAHATDVLCSCPAVECYEYDSARNCFRQVDFQDSCPVIDPELVCPD